MIETSVEEGIREEISVRQLIQYVMNFKAPWYFYRWY